MFFAILLSLLAAKCNESSLEPNYVCCEDEPCKGRCIYNDYSERDSKMQCVTEKEYQICYTGYIYPVFMIILCIPTILFWILSCFTKTNVPKCTWITNIILNSCFAAIIQSLACQFNFESTASTFFLWGGISLFFVIYTISRFAFCSGGPECINKDFNDLIKQQKVMEIAASNRRVKAFSCCNSCYSPKKFDPLKAETEYCCGIDENKAENIYDCIRFMREASSPIVTKEELQTIIEENAVNPPTPQSIGIAFGYNYATRSQMEIDHVIEPIKYGSWQENGVCEKITKQKVIYKCMPHNIYNENMREEIDRANTAALEKVKNIGTSQISYDQFDFNGITRRAIYGDTCTFRVFPRSCYRLFYELIFLCGYNGISDYFWNRDTQRIVFKSIKEISMDDTLRAKCGERDIPELAEKKDDVTKDEEELHQSLL